MGDRTQVYWSSEQVVPGIFSLDSLGRREQYGVMRHGVLRHNEVPKNAEPLTEAVLLILLSLAEQPRHGYAILKDVTEISGDRVVLSTGTLYGALRRLLGDGWIERFEEEEASRDRHAYRLTTVGRKFLQVEVARMNQLTGLAAVRMSLKGA
jgi:DNA-binding PadR family transcriptional regulator